MLEWGLTGPGTTYLAYEHLLDAGKTQEADYAQRAFADYQLRQFNSPSWKTYFSQVTAHLDPLTQGYKAAGADFINFHWYSDDATALADTVSNIQDATELWAVSNEFATNSNDPQPIADSCRRSWTSGSRSLCGTRPTTDP